MIVQELDFTIRSITQLLSNNGSDEEAQKQRNQKETLVDRLREMTKKFKEKTESLSDEYSVADSGFVNFVYNQIVSKFIEAACSQIEGARPSLYDSHFPPLLTGASQRRVRPQKAQAWLALQALDSNTGICMSLGFLAGLLSGNTFVVFAATIMTVAAGARFSYTHTFDQDKANTNTDKNNTF